MLGSCMQMARLSVYVSCIVPSARHHKVSGQIFHGLLLQENVSCQEFPATGCCHLLIIVLLAPAQTSYLSHVVQPTEAQTCDEATAPSSLLQQSYRPGSAVSCPRSS